MKSASAASGRWSRLARPTRSRGSPSACSPGHHRAEGARDRGAREPDRCHRVAALGLGLYLKRKPSRDWVDGIASKIAIAATKTAKFLGGAGSYLLPAPLGLAPNAAGRFLGGAQ
jgi:hypothetical protein